MLVYKRLFLSSLKGPLWMSLHLYIGRVHSEACSALSSKPIQVARIPVPLTGFPLLCLCLFEPEITRLNIDVRFAHEVG